MMFIQPCQRWNHFHNYNAAIIIRSTCLGLDLGTKTSPKCVEAQHLTKLSKDKALFRCGLRGHSNLIM
jgi:hypothetical protein